MARSINDLESWHLKIKIESSMHSLHVLDNCTLWEISSTDLLGNTSSLTSLHVGSSEFVKNESFACIDVTENTENRASKFECGLFFLHLRLDHLLLSGFLLGLELSLAGSSLLSRACAL
jgi:hypothetical protein